MNLAFVEKRIEEIYDLVRKIDDQSIDSIETPDTEAEAHEIEDDLYKDFILFVSENSSGEIQKMAKLIVEVRHIDFKRYR